MSPDSRLEGYRLGERGRLGRAIVWHASLIQVKTPTEQSGGEREDIENSSVVQTKGDMLNGGRGEKNKTANMTTELRRE